MPSQHQDVARLQARMGPPAGATTPTQVDFARRVSANVQRIVQSCQQLVESSRQVDNEEADREGLEVLLHSNLIMASAEDLLRLTNELKLARLTMDWKKQDKHVTEQISKHQDQERRNRATLKRVYDEVQDMTERIEHHRNQSRVKQVHL